MQLQIEAVHQPQGLELVLGEVAAEAPLHLPPEGGDPLGNQGVVEFVVAIH